MFRFWYRFVPENSSIIGRGAADLAYKRIEPYLSDYMGKVFEEICKQYLWKLLLSGESPVQFRELGRWRGTDPSTRSQTEIGIMGEFAKNGFTKGCLEAACNMENVTLVSYKNLLEKITE